MGDGIYTEEFRRRFWSKVHQCAHGMSCGQCCWLWHGAKTGRARDWYGLIWAPPAIRAMGKRYIPAHHAAWEMAYGPVPAGLWVLHDCPEGDNSLCVNYNAHLWVGTARENNHDMIRKGRQRYLTGGARGLAVLSTEAVLAIYALRGQQSQATIAHHFHVAPGTVGEIHRGEKWQWLTGGSRCGIPQAEQVAMLTRQQVYTLRALRGTITESGAARQFGISRSQVGRIWRRECWDWLDDPA